MGMGFASYSPYQEHSLCGKLLVLEVIIHRKGIMNYQFARPIEFIKATEYLHMKGAFNSIDMQMLRGGDTVREC